MRQYRSGDVIAGEYSVQRVFGGEGKSGMGVVYLVTSRDAPAPFVLKTVQPRDSDGDSPSRFVKEAQAWISVGWHPNIVRIYWAREIDSVLHIAAEYIAPDENDRNTLTHHLKTASISPVLVIRWIAQFCYAMAHAKSKGLRAHRDIKPDNLLIDGTENLKVSDFGLASLYEGLVAGSYKSRSYAYGSLDLTGAGSAMGTYPYMAPEQFADSRNVDHRADIYAFGIVLYSLLSDGRYPYPAPKPYRSTNMEAAYAEMHHSAVASELVSPFNRIVQRCLGKKASERYQSYEELVTDVTTIANQLQLSVPPKPNVSEESVEELYAQAQSLVALNQPDRALEAVSRYLALRPRAYWGWTEKGRLHLEQNQLDQAIAATRTSLAQYPENSHAWNNLGIAHRRAGRNEEAMKCFEKALTFDAENIVAMLNIVQPLLALNRYSQVSSILQNALVLCPTKKSLLFNACNAAALMLQRAQLVEAEPVLRLLTKLDERNTQNWHNLALLAQAQGRRGEAIGHLLEVERINPTDTVCLIFLARLHAEAGKFPEAISYCDKLITLDLELDTAVSFKAQLLDRSGQSRDAVALLNTTLRRHPELDGLWFVLSELQISSGNRDDALNALQSCMRVLKSKERNAKEENVRMVEQRINQLERMRK